jgi:hypothetical protein
VVGALGVASLAFGALFFPKTLLASGQHMTAAAKVWARYAAAYSIALSLTMLTFLAVGATRALAGVLAQAALAELLLAVVAAIDKRWEQVPANLVLIALFIACGSSLRGQRLWRLAAWRV